MDIGTRLAQVRKKFGHTQKELSLKLNISQQVLSNYERNTTIPVIDFIYKLADYYNVSIDELVGRHVTNQSDKSIDKQIIYMLEKLDDSSKELVLGLIKEVVSHKKVNKNK